MQKSLLLVAQEKTEFDSYMVALKKQGFHCIYEKNERKILENLRKAEYMGVLVIYQKEWYDAIFICSEIRKQSNILICMVSAYKNDVEMACAVEKNIIYLHKGIAPSNVISFFKMCSEQWKPVECNKKQTEMIEKSNEIELVENEQGVFVNGRKIECSGQARKVLHYLVSQEHKKCTIQEIYQTVWGMEPCISYEKNIRVVINKIRKALQKADSEVHIMNSRNEGYYIVNNYR